MPSLRRISIAGATMVWSSMPSEPSSPACGLRPDIARRGRAMPKRAFRSATAMRAVRDDQLARQLRDRLAQREVDRHRHDGEGRRPQHHHRLRRVAAACREFGEKFGMAGMPEAGAVEHALGDRIGDDGAGASGGDVGDRLADRGERRLRAAVDRAGPAAPSRPCRSPPPARRRRMPRPHPQARRRRVLPSVRALPRACRRSRDRRADRMAGASVRRGAATP